MECGGMSEAIGCGSASGVGPRQWHDGEDNGGATVLRGKLHQDATGWKLKLW